MKRIFKYLSIPLMSLSLIGCDLFGGDNNSATQYTKSFDAITGKFVLHEAADKRYTYTDTYFDIDGSQGNFSLKYYENGVLKREGVFQKVVTRDYYIGKFKDNLHFNVKCGDIYEHISTYTESLNPINQFRIIEEYYNNDQRYYLSELPYVFGTYVREGKEYQQESLKDVDQDFTTSSRDVFTSSLNGYFKIDEEHYFYFVYPNINDRYAKSYFQYYSPDLAKPLEGFATGYSYVNTSNRPSIVFTYSRQVLIYTTKPDPEITLIFGYYTFDSNDRMHDHFGSVNLNEQNEATSFTFEHLSRPWTDEEWDRFTRDQSYHMPDPIIYDYVGGTYTKA